MVEFVVEFAKLVGVVVDRDHGLTAFVLGFGVLGLAWLLPLGLGVLGFLGQQQAAQTQQQAAQIAGQQAANQARIIDYMLRRRQQVFDPIEEQEVIPRLVSRVRLAPEWGATASRWSKSLGAPMKFPISDEPPYRRQPYMEE